MDRQNIFVRILHLCYPESALVKHVLEHGTKDPQGAVLTSLGKLLVSTDVHVAKCESLKRVLEEVFLKNHDIWQALRTLLPADIDESTRRAFDEALALMKAANCVELSLLLSFLPSTSKVCDLLPICTVDCTVEKTENDSETWQDVLEHSSTMELSKCSMLSIQTKSRNKLTLPRMLDEFKREYPEGTFCAEVLYAANKHITNHNYKLLDNYTIVYPFSEAFPLRPSKRARESEE